MKPISKLERIINKRLQFLESLFLISSYKQLIKTNTDQLRQKHYAMEKQQIETISNILRTVRIDQLFKKQFHRIALHVFNKIQPGLTTQKQPSGTHKQIIADYTKFFMQLKQKHILSFISQIFQLQIYSQTTIIYVLAELLLKYLRIKCIAFISDKIQPSISVNKSKFNHFQNFMTLQNQRRIRYQNKSGQKRRHSASPAPKHNNQTRLSNDKQQKNEQAIKLNCKSIGGTSIDLTQREEKSNFGNSRRQLRSAGVRKNSIHFLNDQQGKPKRRIIKSFKDVRQQTKQKIQRNIQNMTKMSFSSSQAYHKVFSQVFKEQWSQYYQLVGIQDIQTKPNENNLRVPQSGFSNRKKSQWIFRNKDRVVVEACSRNDLIRKQMQAYTQVYNANFKIKK